MALNAVGWSNAARFGADLGKNIWGPGPSSFWETTTAKQNYYRTNYINQ